MSQLSLPRGLSRRRFIQLAGGASGAIAVGCATSEESPSLTPEAKTEKGFVQPLGGDLLLEMIEVPAGEFLMGSPEDEADRTAGERPRHRVTAPAFYMGKYPVTQAQWQAVANLSRVERKLKLNPSYFKGDNRPVEKVSWDEAVEFCKRLSRHTGEKYHLPSEAQWEYACRAGTTTPFYFGETISTEQANYNGDYAYDTYGNRKKGQYRRKTTEVGIFPANAFGLYDMHGNVWEWCEDFWHSNYEGAPTDGSAWIEGGELDVRPLRGGAWSVWPSGCRSAYRVRGYLDNRSNGNRSNMIGFRVCCSAPFA